MKTLSALEMQRGKTYKVTSHLVPRDVRKLDHDEDFFIFTIDSCLEFDGTASIVTNEGKCFSLPASQYVIELQK
jgi:hypothetical protein